jgi:hypothetical protein
MNATSANAQLAIVQEQMDRLGDCTTDAPMVFVNGFGRVCAKIQSRNHGTIAGWGDEIEEALAWLSIEIAKKN